MSNVQVGAREIPPLKSYDIGDVQFPYLYYEGEAPSILFAHATGFLPWLWHPIIEDLTPPQEAWAPYFCNYRNCDPEKNGLPWDVIAKDVTHFCNSLNIHESLAVGHSMGATVLTIASALFGLSLQGMILIEPIFLPEEFYAIDIKLKDHPLAAQALKRKNSWKDEKAALEYLRSKALFANWNEQMLHLYIKYGMEKQTEGELRLTCSPRNEAALFMGSKSTNPWPLLKGLTCPVLIVEGERSTNQHYIDLKKAASLLKNGKYISVADAGHLIPMEKPKEIIEIIRNFMADLSVRH